MKVLMHSKKAQLFIIEAFIAVTVMIIMVTALYEVQLITQPSAEPNFGEEMYNTLKILDANNQLDKYIYTLMYGPSSEISSMKNLLEQAFYGSLPDNGEFTLFCENATSGKVIVNSWINEGLTPSKELIVISYFLSSVYGTYTPCIFNLQVWLLGV